MRGFFLLFGCLVLSCQGVTEPMGSTESHQETPGQNRCASFLARCSGDALVWCDENSGEKSVLCSSVGATCSDGACRVGCNVFGEPRCQGNALVSCRADGVLQWDDCSGQGEGFTCGATSTHAAACHPPQP